ncbi:cytochrome P450 26A1-like [Mytilus galloprovincialis]|uniref:cytochrome P450 26A1-like n=1 Tax=Mytilus galloprovincialis TaxID=29158 RepID=UPI003F7BDFD5
MLIDFIYSVYSYILSCYVLYWGLVIVGCPAIVHVLIKFCWNYYIILWCVTDNELSHLPIPPGTLGYPFIGETIEFIRKNDRFYKSRQDKYGSVYRTHVLGRPTIRVSGAHNLRKILMSENSYVSSQWPPSIRKVLGPYALSMMDDIHEHKERKRLLINLFLPDALNDHIPIIRKTIKHFIDEWCQKGKILGYPQCRNLAFIMAAKCLAGFECDDEMGNELSTIYQSMIHNMFSLPIELPGFGLYKALKAKRQLIQRISENIQKLQNIPVDDRKGVSALDFLLREEDENCRFKTCESIVELMFASHDTTSSAMCSCLMFLGKYPNVIKKVREEIGSDDLDNLTLNDFPKYKYAYNVTKEVLRMTPPVGAGYRKVLKSFQLEGYKIPKGWTVAYGIRDTHHTSPLYTNSDVFNPDRWDDLPNFDRITPDNLETRYNYATFGGGPRTCIGKDFAKLVLKLFVLHVCKSCDWNLENKDAELYYIPVPRAVDGLPLVVQKRKNDHSSNTEDDSSQTIT